MEIKTYPDEDSELTEQSHHHHMCLAEIQGLSGEWGKPYGEKIKSLRCASMRLSAQGSWRQTN